MRTAQGPEDGTGFADIHQARADLDGVDPSDSYEMAGPASEFIEALVSAKAAGNLARRPVIEIDGRIAAYGKIEEWSEADGTAVYLLMGWTHPDYRGRGYGSALLGWMEAEAAALAGRDHPGSKREYAANASSTETGATRLLAKHGYAAEFTVAELRLNLAAYERIRPALPGVPQGLSATRPAPGDLAELARAVHDSFVKEYDGGRFDESPDPDEYAEELEGKDSRHWLVAREAGRIVAVALFDTRDTVRGKVAELSEVAVLPSHRKRGLASALIAQALDGVLAEGVREVRVYTVEQFKTRAVDLYQRLGFERYKDFPRYRKAML